MPDLDFEHHKMEILQAALPYIPVSMQKFIHIYIGFEELIHAISIIRSGPNLQYTDHLDYDKNKLGNQKELVETLKKYCSPKENEMIDMFFQFSNMINMYEKYKDLFHMEDFFHLVNPEGTQKGNMAEDALRQASNQSENISFSEEKSSSQKNSSSAPGLFSDPSSFLNLMNQINHAANNPAVDEIFRNL